MPRFFTYFHAPVFWTVVLTAVWSVAGYILAQPAGLITGIVLILAFGALWGLFHYTPRSVKETLVAPNNRVANLAELAARQNFFIGTIGYSNRLDVLEAVLGKHFNSMTPGFETKWAALSPTSCVGEYNFDGADRVVDLALSKGARVRGHTLIWGKFDMPSDLSKRLKQASNPADELCAIIHRHVTTVMNHFRGRISEWDVINEPLDYRRASIDHSVFYEHLGEEYIDFTFKCAREADPKCRLFINEQLWNYRNRRALAFIDLLKRLRKRGAEIDGVGLQGHANVPPLPAPGDLKSYLQQLAALGFEIEITEFDALLRFFCGQRQPYKAQGRYFESILKACLEVPQCRGLTVWGLTDGECWYESAPHFRRFGPHEPFLLDRSMQPKPAYWGFCQALESATPCPATPVKS